MKTVSIRLTHDEAAALEECSDSSFRRWTKTRHIRAALWAYFKAQGIDPKAAGKRAKEKELREKYQ